MLCLNMIFSNSWNLKASEENFSSSGKISCDKTEFNLQPTEISDTFSTICSEKNQEKTLIKNQLFFHYIQWMFQNNPEKKKEKKYSKIYSKIKNISLAETDPFMYLTISHKTTSSNDQE